MLFFNLIMSSQMH